MGSLSEEDASQGRSIDWAPAHDRLESYFCSLQIQDRLLLSQLVARILSQAAERADSSELSPDRLAMEEAKKVVESWFAAVLDAAGLDRSELGARGRLALFLADMPRRWQAEFLRPGPWPEGFLRAMKQTYLITSPDFSEGRMTPREIDLGPVSAVADETWRVIDRWPILGAAMVWALYLGALGAIVYMLR